MVRDRVTASETVVACTGGDREDEMKEGGWTSGILQERGHPAVDMCYPSREGMNTSEGSSEVGRVSTTTIGPGGMGLGSGMGQGSCTVSSVPKGRAGQPS